MHDRDSHDKEDWSETGAGYDSSCDADDDDLETDGDESDDAIPCPDCGIPIYADLDHCPQCGHWLTDADRRGTETGLFASRNLRLVAAALLVIFALGLIASILGLAI